MKKLVLFPLLWLAISALAGCGSDAPASPKDSSASPQGGRDDDAAFGTQVDLRKLRLHGSARLSQAFQADLTSDGIWYVDGVSGFDLPTAFDQSALYVRARLPAELQPEPGTFAAYRAGLNGIESLVFVKQSGQNSIAQVFPLKEMLAVFKDGASQGEMRHFVEQLELRHPETDSLLLAESNILIVSAPPYAYARNFRGLKQSGAFKSVELNGEEFHVPMHFEMAKALGRGERSQLVVLDELRTYSAPYCLATRTSLPQPLGPGTRENETACTNESR